MAAQASIGPTLKKKKVNVLDNYDAGDFICEETVYTLYKGQSMGKIKAGLFMHVPKAKFSAKEQQVFAKALIAALFDSNGQPKPGVLVPDVEE